MRHHRGDDRKEVMKTRLIAEAIRSHNRHYCQNRFLDQKRWNSVEDIPEKDLRHILRDRVRWHCHCGYCLDNKTHKNDVRDAAMEAEWEYFLEGGYDSELRRRYYDEYEEEDTYDLCMREVRHWEREVMYAQRRLDEAQEDLWSL